MTKKSISIVLRSAVLLSLTVAFAANATQTVQPVKDTAGTAFAGSSALWTSSVPVGTVVTVIGRYSSDNTDGNESGLGLKVKYDETKFTTGTVTVTALSTKCMIAPPQLQSAGAASQAVLGWIDTATRTPAGTVAWPYAADPPSSPPTTTPCLNPNTPANDTTATAAGAVNLFRFQGTLAPAVAVGSTTDITVTAEGNFSYAGPATPGMANQVVRITAAAAPTCNLDVDNSTGAPTAGVDGILIKRALNSFIPAANITIGVTFPLSATRTLGSDIRAYVLGLGNVLDVDGNGAAAPVAGVDGVLIQRALNTFITSAAVTIGVATSATGAQVRTYLNSVCGTSLTP